MRQQNDRKNSIIQIALQEKMIHRLKLDGYIHSNRIEDAFRAVPRHLFLPEVTLEEVYSYYAVVTKYHDGIPISSSSQPPRMAIMLEQLNLEPGQCVLEVGAGTGYNAGLIGHIVGNDGYVVSIEIDEDITETARENIKASGCKNVQTILGDGGLGYPEAAPYDRIILSVGAWDIAPAWIEQLKPEGLLLLPLWIRGEQRTIAFKKEYDCLVSVSIERCGFVRLRGSFGGPEAFVSIHPSNNVILTADDPNQINIKAINEQLQGPYQDQPIGIQVTADEVFHDLSLWLAVHEPDFFILTAERKISDIDEIPFLYGYPGQMNASFGVRSQKGICLLIHPISQTKDFSRVPEDDAYFDLIVRAYDADETLTKRLISHIKNWVDSKRPSVKDLHVRAYSFNTDYNPRPNEKVIPKKWMKYVFSWPEK
jgi:protein-L-isoaspartate(D-aspartate) O-methyltransferase